ncbi:hypothetical protein BC830DRAFT_1143648 [Chytriomyces sp. MP71]|nr:hypothetical protein BC830DRAFT_1143648 [Chytriomyces sp. MP71]
MSTGRQSAISSREIFLVTGVTGKVGYQAALYLLEKKLPVRVLLRKDAARAAEFRAKGAQVIVGDLMSTHDVRRAVTKDVKAALFVPAIDLMMIQAAAVFAAAIEDAQVPHLTMLSQWYASPNHPSTHTQQIWLAERIFLRLAPTTVVTRIRVGLFADNHLSRGLLANAIHLGVIPNFWEDGGMAPVSNEDLGASCAATMAEPARVARHGIVYRPTGPKLMKFTDMVEVVSKVVGRPVTEMHLGKRMAMKAMTQGGLPWFPQQAVLEYAEAYSARAQELVVPTDHVEYLTGRAPESYEVTVCRYAKVEGAASFGGALKAMGQFMSILMTSAFDIPKEMTHIQIPKGSVEPMNSEEWAREMEEVRATQYLMKDHSRE